MTPRDSVAKAYLESLEVRVEGDECQKQMGGQKWHANQTEGQTLPGQLSYCEVFLFKCTATTWNVK